MNYFLPVKRRGLYTFAVSSILFPIHELLKRHHTLSVRKNLEASQWWTTEKIQTLQLQRLKELLRDVQENVPYYRALFEQLGFNPDEIYSVEDLQKLPFLDKARIRANTESLKSLKASDLARFNTGGSSGEPLVFYIGKERVSHDVAAKWRATRWWDVDIGDKEIVVWGSPIELGSQDSIRVCRDRLFRTTLIPAFEMSESKLDTFLDTIQKVRPKMLFGYPSSLSHIARHAKVRGRRMDNLGIKVAFVTSERLYPDQRDQISEAFGCKVANGYGGRDAGFIAHECPSGGMHITAEDIIVEIIDPQGRVVPYGQSGEIVVTHLATKDFPFIRYRTGDIGILDDTQCTCGRGLPLLKEIQGRTTDFVIAKDGTVMHGLALIYILRDIPEITAFKIIQESIDCTRVLVVSNYEIHADIKKKIENDFQKRLGEDVTIVINEVSDIPAEKSGKYRYVSSKIADKR